MCPEAWIPDNVYESPNSWLCVQKPVSKSLNLWRYNLLLPELWAAPWPGLPVLYPRTFSAPPHRPYSPAAETERGRHMNRLTWPRIRFRHHYSPSTSHVQAILLGVYWCWNICQQVIQDGIQDLTYSAKERDYLNIILIYNQFLHLQLVWV